ncbi:MAG: hypothetical protein ABII06_15745, partial [Pseudomonadota bacterium]
MNDFRVNLFPHSMAPEARLKTMVFFFGPIQIFQPWEMDCPDFLSNMEKEDVIRIIRPPLHLSPGETFRSLLKEYRNWIAYHGGKGGSSFLKVNPRGRDRDEHTWEIRKEIRGMDSLPSDPASGETLKWHLILHLAREIEDNCHEAERELENLRKKKSPLRGSIEQDEELKDLFDDLPGFDAGPFIDEGHLEQIMDAWVGLFGDSPGPRDCLVTLNRHVLDALSDSGKVGEDSGGAADRALEFSFPDFSQNDWHSLVQWRRGQSAHDLSSILQTLCLGTEADRERGLERIKRIADDLEGPSQMGTPKGRIQLSLKHLTRVGREHGKLKVLSGKAMFLLEEKKSMADESNRTGILKKEGWAEQFVAGEPRLSEAVEIYKEAGFDVHLEPLPKETTCDTYAGEEGEGKCRACFEGFEDQYKIIFTKKKEGA